ARGRADQRLLDTYEGERRPLARNVLRATSTAVGIMLPDSAWKRAVRDHVVLPAFRLPAVQRKLWLAATQLGISYRGGPLAPHSHRWTPSPRPGDRMPGLTSDGTARWLVLAADHEQAVRHARAAAALVGEDLVSAQTADVRGVVLVRPDGHVGWRGAPGPDRLAAWLNEVLWPR
ncbi:MAG: FAD-binding monooxygenase, partial [Nonomuraea sp.]|nr:FAD-binding monooxygenase [Nonomuraea sp.]